MLWPVQDPKKEHPDSFKDRTAEQGFLCIAVKQQSGNQLCFVLPRMCVRLLWVDVNCDITGMCLILFACDASDTFV